MNKLILILAVCALGGSLLAANPGDEVIVIYNKRMPESKGLAEYYAARRNVPKGQIFGFALSTGDNMTRSEFENSLEKPLVRALRAKDLWHIGSVIIPATTNRHAQVQFRVRDSKIRYAVLCYGVPFRILEDPNLHEPSADDVRPELRRNGAALDNDLALLPLIEERPPLTGFLNNPLYAATNEAAFNPSNGILMVARLDGPSVDIARGLVDKAIEAETNGLWGRAYIDMRDIADPNYKIGDTWMSGAAEICERMGFETVVDHNPGTFPREFPMSQIAFYCGWYAGNVDGPFLQPHVEFMPGAFAYHLHSFSAHSLRSATENWVGPLLAKGATASMGSIDEPYLGGTPNMAVFAGRLLVFNFTFGEAAYASQAVVSWQTTVVGDPLYRPMAIPERQLQDELEARHSKLVEWSLLRVADVDLARGVPKGEIAALIEHNEITKKSAVLTEKLGDLYSELGKPSSAVEMWETAAILDPSPLQLVRLRTTLAAKLESLDRYQDAMNNLEKLLSEDPGYPAKIEIYKKLVTYADKLGKKDIAAGFQSRVQELTPVPKQ